MQGGCVAVLALGILALAGLVVLPLYNKQWASLDVGRLSDAEYRALGSLPGWKTDEQQVARGVILRGLVRAPSEPGRPWIMFLAGNGAGLLQDSRATLDEMFAGLDYGLAVWAYRGFDGSGGNPSVVTSRADMRLLYDHVARDLAGPSAPIHLVGFSLGGDMALLLAVDVQSGAHPPKTLTVMSSSPTDYKVLPRTWCRRWTVFHEAVDAANVIGQLRMPLLLVHGEADMVNPVEDVRLAAKQLTPRGRYIELPGGDHTSPLKDAKVHDAILALVQDRQ